MKNYQKINNITGWVVFLIAAFTFLSTIEPTGSFWDCGEFIASAHKLEVGHPPGAPFFMLISRLFSALAIDNAHVPYMINLLSGLASSFTILFLFWSITHMAKKLAEIGNVEFNKGKMIAVLGSGVI